MIISQTPVRLSFLGGNTDFREYYLNYGGKVIATTIDKYIYCIVKKRFDDLIYVNYMEKEMVEWVCDLKHDIVRECLKWVGIEKGIEISFLADIPAQGSGLGSSSSLTVGLLNALHAYLGENVSSNLLVKEAVMIELDILKRHGGVQDQLIAVLGGLRLLEFNTGGEFIGRRIEMKEKEDFNNSLMLFYTGVTRKTDKILSKFDVSKNLPLLHQKKLLVEDGVTALLKGDLTKFGELLNFNWTAKNLLGDSDNNKAIESMREKAMKAGAIGVKLIGAGGGGFLLVMFPANKRTIIREALKDYKEMPFRFVDFGSRIILNI